MTSETRIRIRDKVFQMGANDFVQKLFVASDMLPRVKRFVG